MRTLVAFLFLVLLSATACTSTAQKELEARGPMWPMGTYELISFHGQDLPAELPDGRTPNSGSCTLSERCPVPKPNRL